MNASPKPANFDEYIADQPPKVRPMLKKLRQIVRKTAPDAKEVISYGMPAYKLHGMLLYFAAFTNHYSLFAFPSAIVAFKDRLKGYETSKGTIKFPLDKPVPVKLITEIVKFKVRENINKQLAKALAKKTQPKRNRKP
ncbi:MAG TPA: DUF1801 domain-containing protein [Cyclobacteriaceae bacterium]|nr:DUF1801 domain-containing protein [Cyclobacteriaceae bacterium]